jgi:hypothetical protein
VWNVGYGAIVGRDAGPIVPDIEAISNDEAETLLLRD